MTANDPVTQVVSDPSEGDAAEVPEFALEDLQGTKPVEPQGKKYDPEQQERYIDELKGRLGTEHDARIKLETELDGLKSRFGEFEQRPQQAGADGEAETGPTLEEMFAITKEQETEFDEYPVKGFKHLGTKIAEYNKQLVDRLSHVLAAMQENTTSTASGEVGELKSVVEQIKRRTDPNLSPWLSTIDEMRKDEALKNLPDSTLISIAKKLNMKPAMQYAGSPVDGSTQAGIDVRSMPRDDVKSLIDKEAKVFMQQLNIPRDMAYKAAAKKLGVKIKQGS